jgi:hypothetical protein
MSKTRWIRSGVFLACACLLAGTAAWAQKNPASPPKSQVSTDLSVTYSLEHAKLSPGSCGCFWLQGAGVDATVSFWKGLGLAASFNGEHAGNAAPGVDVNKIDFTAGPRYTYTAWRGHATATDQRRLQVFGRTLFGYMHGFNGVYPASGGVVSSAGSFAFEGGGGLNLFFTRKLGVRLIQVEYVRSSLPNNASNAQNDVRLSFGLVYHFGGSAPAAQEQSSPTTPAQ